MKGLNPLVFFSPEALFELSDRQEQRGEIAIIEPKQALKSGQTPEIGSPLRIYTAAPESQDADSYAEMQQDGITLLISNTIRPGPQQQINVELKRGWLKKKLIAYISGKQQVPGFMGTRDCR